MMELKFTAHEGLLRDNLQTHRISKKALSAIKRDGALLVNNIERTVRHQCTAQDEITVILPKELPSPALLAEEMKLDILFEDEFLLIVSKQAGISTMPSQLHPHGSLLEGVLYYFQQHQMTGIPHIVTRLDRQTSGIVVFAKHQLVHHLMTGIIDKLYLTAVEGKLPSRGEINLPIKRKADSIIERITADDGKQAKTSYITLHSGEFSIALVKLHTGRTHQIRVHFKAIGHPLIGDSLYGTSNSRIGRQALHAFEVSFVHPFTHRRITIQDKPPKDLTHLMPML